MNEEELQRWLKMHGGYAGQKQNERTIAASEDRAGRTTPAQRVVDSITYEAGDGATITVKQREAPAAGSMGPSLAETDAIYERVGETPPDKTRLAAQRTPEQVRNDSAVASKNEEELAKAQRERDERWWNQNKKDEGGSGLPETHLERAERVAREQQAERLREAEQRQKAESDARMQAQKDDTEERRQTRLQGIQDKAADRNLTQQQIDIQRENAERAAKKPDFLNQADSKTKQIARYDPVSGGIVYSDNPNYDAVKAAAEEKRAELASQIASRDIDLREATARYTQWFETNVKTPLMLAEEARAKAAEQRAALDAEERRRQFSADFGLRKATLGESASQRATNAEISLLPYRAGPTEAAEMSSAINSLAAGGKINGPDAGAGVHFTPGAFQFNAPDFAGIAKKAASQVLSGLTDYRPSKEQYATADYSGVPKVNLSGAPTLPAYQPPAAAPAPVQ